MATPLRPIGKKASSADEVGPGSPEALLISALVEEGNFDPHHWRIEEDDLSCYSRLWKFCCDYQSRAGMAPPPSVIAAKFPDFELIPDVDPHWAASKLREASASRKLRERFREALIKLNEDDLEGAYQALDGYMVPVNTRRAPFDAFELLQESSEIAVDRVPMPWEPFYRATCGGQGPGEVLTVAARGGQGKTNIVCGGYVARAMQEGFNVIYFSLEMPARQIKRKVNRALAQRISKSLLAGVDSMEIEEHNAALEHLAEQVPGRLGVYDPTHGPCDVRAVRDAMAEADLVVVDHIGLMRLGNKSAISDWRIQAEISNRCKEETLRCNSRLLEVAQINRAGDSTSPLRTPRLSELGGADQIGQDADFVVTMNRYSASVMLHSAEKVREGPSVRWFTRYDPGAARFDMITRDQAQQLAVEDEDAAERNNR